MFCLILFLMVEKLSSIWKVVERQRELQKKNDRSRFPTIEKYMRGDSSRRRYKHSTLFLNTKSNPRRKSDIMGWMSINHKRPPLRRPFIHLNKKSRESKPFVRFFLVKRLGNRHSDYLLLDYDTEFYDVKFYESIIFVKLY